MSPYYQPPTGILGWLAGAAVVAAVVTPVWRWFSTGEVSEMLIYPTIAIGMLLAAVLLPHHPARRVLRVFGVFFWMLLLAFPLVPGQTALNWRLIVFSAWCAVAFGSGAALYSEWLLMAAFGVTAILGFCLWRW
jgi:hypothetical protein